MENNTGATETVETVEETNLPKTQEELDALLQSYADKRVSQALKTVEKKNADKVREAEKLAKMDEQTKYEYELQKREEAIAQKERELSLLENTNAASKILADKGLSLDLVDFVVAEDAETMDANIKKLERAFKASVKAEVSKTIAGKSPVKPTSKNDTGLTNEEIAKIKSSYSKMMELKASDPELYEQIK